MKFVKRLMFLDQVKHYLIFRDSADLKKVQEKIVPETITTSKKRRRTLRARVSTNRRFNLARLRNNKLKFCITMTDRDQCCKTLLP